MRRGARAAFLFPAAIALCGAFVLRDSLTRMTYYDHARGAPGPGFLPFWLAVGMIVLGAILALRAVRAAPAVAAVSTDGAASERWRSALVLVALMLALIALEPLGFVATAASLVIVVAFALGQRTWRVLLPAAIAAAVGIYALFTWLGVALPAGVLGL